MRTCSRRVAVGWPSKPKRAWIRARLGIVALVFASAFGQAAEPVTPPRQGEGAAGRVWSRPKVKAVDRTPKRVAVQRVPPSIGQVDGLRRLGDVKALDVRDGEALFRIDGREQRLKPGMLLKTDVVKSITPQRMVLVRPENVDEKRGETLIIIDFSGPGRSRVRMYATRDWTARPVRPVE